MTGKEKMMAGMWYDANYNQELTELRFKTQELLLKFNQTPLSHQDDIHDLYKKLFGTVPKGLTIIAPLTVDYGSNISFGENVFVNASCYFMDGAKITIGHNVFIGPYCGFYTASHPLAYKYRNQGLEKASPIVVGDNCWFGANVSVMPGVKIGNGCVMGAGSVVTKDVPDNSLVTGVPAKVIKVIAQNGELED